MINISLIVASVCIGAIADGLNERGMKSIGHPAEALEKVTLLLAGLLSGTWIVLISYIAFRVAIFDYVKNIAKKQPILYLGTVSMWDRFFSKWQPVGLIFMRVLFLTLAISVSLRHLF